MSLNSVQGQSASEVFTDARGFYSFEGVEPGSWVVKATLSSPALSVTYDSAGATDWSVPVSVPINGEARGDFAAAGGASVSGSLTNQAGTTVPDGSAEIVWAGPDGRHGTDDDVVFPVTVRNGVFALNGVPEGSYMVKGQASDGRTARDVSLDVKPGDNKTNLRVIDSLPETGGDQTIYARIALLMLLAGLLLVKPARKRN